MSDSERNELANRDYSHVGDVLGIAGLVASAVGAPVGGALVSGGGMLASAAARLFEQRRRERDDRHAKLVIENLAVRLKGVETREISNDEIDLFGETFRRAVAEDDARKISFHGAYIAWMARQRRDLGEARLLGDAISQLTYEELRAFVQWGKDGGGFSGDIYLRGAPVTQDVFYHRLDATGLLTQGGSVRGAQFRSEIGNALVSECRGDELS